MIVLITVFAALLCVWVRPAMGATVLFDFEDAAEVRCWHDEGKPTLSSSKTLEQVTKFAASGSHSMRFSTPAWRPEEHGGQHIWPAFECKPIITDWSRFDRLAMTIVNATQAPQRLMLFISDSKTPTRKGVYSQTNLPPWGYAQTVIDLRSGFAKQKLDPADINVMHFFTESPPVDMTVYIDSLLLLEPGEPLPPLPTSFLKDFGALQLVGLDALGGVLDEAEKRMKQVAATAPAASAWLSEKMTGFRGQLADLRRVAEQGDEAVLDLPTEMSKVSVALEHLESRLALLAGFEKVRPQVQVGEKTGADVAVGFATSMEKILPRADVPGVKVGTEAKLSLARGETESLQVIVMPYRGSLSGVQVRVGQLRSDDGHTFPPDSIHVPVVGYVETKVVPPYGSSHVGWWPDPILDFLDTADIAEGDAQAFWVRVRAPRDQRAGIYHGNLEVVAHGKPLFRFGFSVRVYDFEVPAASPLPLAITFGPHDHPTEETQAEQVQWRQSPDYPINAWRRHKAEWGNFLADYYITMDSLYHSSLPNFDVLEVLRDQGRLGWFNLGYYGPAPEAPEEFEKWKQSTLPRLREAYQRAKALGILDHAYIYGCDEAGPELFPQVQRAAETLKAEFPEVPIMTTTFDHSFGLDSVMKAVDWWCPLTPRMNVETAAKARAEGRQVWWYICCGPHHPFANMFIEYPAIEGRLLMGAMTAKYRPDGFLYYQISIWNSQRPIESGPFTQWDPRSWTTYHGDGSWTCVGPDGTPLPTIRLENFRDGLEDYAYYRILEATVARIEASAELRAQRAQWLARANELLKVPEEVAASLTTYTHDPAAVYGWRNAMAEAIMSAGIEPANPWAK